MKDNYKHLEGWTNATMLRVCFTGHRPERIGGYDNLEAERVIKQELTQHVRSIMLSDLSTDVEFITGMAQGFDTIAGEVIVKLKNKYPKRIKLIAAIPFVGQQNKWTYEGQKRYIELLIQCDNIVWVDETGYAPWKMHNRNKWMVDHSNEVVALWSGSSGGTANCIAYANKVGKKATNLWTNIEGKF
jgi:uncharacterized phage-like protein YoqJ